MERRINLAMGVPAANDPTSWYRAVGPFGMLKTQMPELDLLFSQPINDWPSLKLSDLLFLQRPCNPQDFEALCIAKDLGKPVWSDFDDDNTMVSRDNPMAHAYNQPHVKDAIVKIIRASDVVTVSTEFLAQKYSIWNKNVVLIPNAIPDEILGMRQIPDSPREKIMMWRGTATHAKNVKTVEKEVIELAKKYPDWKFVFFGCDLYDLTENIKNHQLIGQYKITDFYKVMIQVRATCLWYALADNDHAKSRSHVSWLEATWGDMGMIAPAMKEFERPGVMNFQDPGVFFHHMDSVMKGDIDINRRVKESWDYIKENYLLSRTNQIRMEIIRKLVNRS